ncbi:MAG: caspase, EACC1-associated type [Nostoc sp. SerVER01]|nr:ABC transporter substrate-binding protein [Nostoc sp. SerVER01]
MAKVALLIGVSEYEPGLTPLPAAAKDIEAMQQVLLNPDIGGFDDVTPLLNPQQYEMGEAIERLFDGRQRDDLVLLFFSGHGIRDEEGRLYFATRNTRKTLLKSTTVPASLVHDVMSKSRSKHEVVILDCCFSGAFAEGMLARDDGFIDVKNQLGGEGRAILTSSTSNQFSFEQPRADTSTYTRYIVEGLETGAADKNQDGWISVDELHDYAKGKVQEAAPAMKPEIYAIKEGYKINLAKAPIDDPELQYRREVEYWVESGNGEISDAGRDVLDELRHQLGLTSEEALAIENKVLEPQREYQRKVKRYEERFIKEIQREYPISDNTREELKRFQKVLRFTDENIALIEAPIIAEQSPISSSPSPSVPSRPPKSKFISYIRAFIIGIIGAVIGGTVIYVFGLKTTVQSIENSCDKEPYNLGDIISLGEEILLKQDTNLDKEGGVKAFLNGDCSTAINNFNLYRQANPTDPEALIYLNNAKAREKGEWLKIAVSVPIGTNPNVAKEMLRGVAQAQDEVNSSGGINGKALEVAIANDDNDPSQAEKIAKQFTNDKTILAVVGHNSSEASSAAGKVYIGKGGEGLVMIAPTSFDQNLTDLPKYIFRTAPTNYSLAETLSDYVIQKTTKPNILICIDSANGYQQFKNDFRGGIKTHGGIISPEECNISDNNVSFGTVISKAKATSVNGLVLAFPVDKIQKGLALAQANRGQLPLFAYPSLYTDETLRIGKADIDGMVLVVPWHPTAFPNSPFVQNANALWKAPVNWRTATSYDATKAIIAGLQKSNTREELQQALHDPSFSVDGATGRIQFTKSGDRKNSCIFLVKVQPISGSDKYKFEPIPEALTNSDRTCLL